ncbi:SDR family oxidoreductase [Methylovirgula sp. 4M-Z18]|uniref:SDR family oxidoreductase n=1 Tax=Methylovirgula sp. 4M-Z18 TaxID=2293567 RepID=UPI000E2F8AE4|nr:SDR family oxidoreductase [Methylovirgula sp. 4M-Z18]RFB75570.1 SDR family oxidoreductase [Methylovirgula sp. 4M-Z18]
MSLLIFGLGYTAQYYVRHHAADGTQIVGTARTQDKVAALTQAGFNALVFDGQHGTPELYEALARAEHVLVSIPPDGLRDPVLDVLRDALAVTAQLTRIVYLSTVGVYGDHGGAWVDETTAPNPKSARSVARVAVENEWSALAAQTGKAVHILRLAGIYGPGRNTFVNLRNGTAKRLIKPDQVFNRIHVEDIARAIRAAFAHDGGGLWNVTDDYPAPPQDVVTYGASLLGVEPPAEQDFASARLTAMARSFYGENKRVSNAKMKRDLGVALAYPTYREALAAILKDEAF